MSAYAKAIAAFLGSLATWGVSAGADGNYSQVELWGLAGVVATVLATYAIPNKPSDPPTGPTGPVQP